MIEQYDIKLDDLPPEFREIAEHIGLEPALRLVEIRAGEGVYVPKPEKICRAARDRAIRAEFDGRNYRDLARKYSLTVAWIRSIVDNRPDAAAGGCIERQLELF